MQSISDPMRSVGMQMRACIVWQMPASPAQAPMKVYTKIRIPLTLNPALSAETRLPPMA